MSADDGKIVKLVRQRQRPGSMNDSSDLPVSVRRILHSKFITETVASPAVKLKVHLQENLHTVCTFCLGDWDI